MSVAIWCYTQFVSSHIPCPYALTRYYLGRGLFTDMVVCVCVCNAGMSVSGIADWVGFDISGDASTSNWFKIFPLCMLYSSWTR